MREKVKDAHNLSDEQWQQLLHVLMNSGEVFNDKPGLCNQYTHKIDRIENKIITHNPRIMPYAVKNKVKVKISEMLENRIIEVADVPTSNPLCIVIKPDGDVRVTNDAHSLNSDARPDPYRPAVIEELLTKAAGAKFLSIIDLTQAFLQNNLELESRKSTAFTFDGRQYLY